MKASCHILFAGWPLCGFSRTVPGEWPAGNVWCSTIDVEKARERRDLELCPRCEEVFARRLSFKESLGG